MNTELIPTGVTFGVGRNSINESFSGTAEFNNIKLDSGANFSGGTGGGIIFSGGTDLYDIFTNFLNGFVSGSGTTDTITKWSSSSSIVDSQIEDDGSHVSVYSEKLRRKSTLDFGTTGGTIVWNIDDSSNAKIRLDEDATLEILNVENGDSGVLKIIQDDSGSHSITFGSGTHIVSNNASGTTTLTTAPNSVDIISFFYDNLNFSWVVDNNYT